MIVEEISGWLHDQSENDDQPRTQPKTQNLRSYSLCNKKEECDKLISNKSGLFQDRENNSQFIKSKAQKKQNSTIEELKKVMEFLAINEQYKYETHRAFDPNDEQFIKNQQQQIEKHKQQQELKKNKFKLQLDIKDNYQSIPRSRRILQPLTETGSQLLKVNSERSQLNQQNATQESRSQTQIKFKLPKFIIQQQQRKKQHIKTDELISPKEYPDQPKKHFIQINKIFNSASISETKISANTPKPISQKKQQIYMQHTMSTMNQNINNPSINYDAFLKRATNNIQEAKDRQRQLKLLEIALKCKNIK